MNLSILNSFCYTVGWFWCVLLSIHGHPVLAIIGVAFLILFQLYFTKINDVSLYIQGVILVIFSIPIGALLEIFFSATGLIHYANTSKILPPIWIILLYPLFALLLNHSLKIIKKNYFTSFIMGFLGAPLSYIAGNSLGALTFSHPVKLTWVIIGISWGFFLCFLVKIERVIESATTETLEDSKSEKSLKLLYDGECPICQREICILQRKNNQNRIKFVDIAAKDFSPLEKNNIDYNTAMTEIHAIDDKGNFLIGIQAFATVYARCNLLVISTLLRIPFVKKILKPLYALFAKKRLWLTGRMSSHVKK
jgi:predicted DCC family thiol-disulfide oxidoreductase YuxK